MSGLGADVVLSIFAAGSGFGASWLTNRRSNKTTQATNTIATGKLELDNRREDGAAYERAQQINKEIVQSLRDELKSLQSTIASLRAEFRTVQQHSALLENYIRDLEASAATMRDLLRGAHVEYPAPPTRPEGM